MPHDYRVAYLTAEWRIIAFGPDRDKAMKFIETLSDPEHKFVAIKRIQFHDGKTLLVDRIFHPLLDEVT